MDALITLYVVGLIQSHSRQGQTRIVRFLPGSCRETLDRLLRLMLLSGRALMGDADRLHYKTPEARLPLLTPLAVLSHRQVPLKVAPTHLRVTIHSSHLLIGSCLSQHAVSSTA